jgi:hypothetical protein
VKKGLQDAYASKVPGGQLEVFCVSNTTYEKYSKKGNSEMVTASGIPELRRFCHTITAGARLLEGKHFLTSTLSSLLNSVGLWANTRSDSPQVNKVATNKSIHDILESTKEEVRQLYGFSVQPDEVQVSSAIKNSKRSFGDIVREVLFSFLGKLQLQ